MTPPWLPTCRKQQQLYFLVPEADTDSSVRGCTINWEHLHRVTLVLSICCLLWGCEFPSALLEMRAALLSCLDRAVIIGTAFRFSRKAGTAPLTHIFCADDKNGFITTSKSLYSVLVNSKFILGFHPRHKTASFSSIKTITLLVLALRIQFPTLNLYLLFVRGIYHPAL